jgi:hypothetical protein
VRHRGLTVEVWTGSGRWRPRTMGGAIPAIHTEGVDALVAVLTAEELPGWMARRAG